MAWFRGSRMAIRLSPGMVKMRLLGWISLE